jgi:NADH-quinone oxidoreductase subunit M
VVFAVSGLILGALYMLWTYERVMFGPITKAVNETIRDLTPREVAVMAPVLALMLFMGFYPKPLLSRMEPSVITMLARVHVAQARMDSERRHSQLARTTDVTASPAAPHALDSATRVAAADK